MRLIAGVPDILFLLLLRPLPSSSSFPLPAPPSSSSRSLSLPPLPPSAVPSSSILLLPTLISFLLLSSLPRHRPSSPFLCPSLLLLHFSPLLQHSLLCSPPHLTFTSMNLVYVHERRAWSRAGGNAWLWSKKFTIRNTIVTTSLKWTEKQRKYIYAEFLSPFLAKT